MKLIFLATIAALLLQPSGAADAESSPLDAARQQFDTYTPENFDKGGAISHYQWLNFSAFYPHTTLYRTQAIRPLRLNLKADVAIFNVHSTGEQTTLANYVEKKPHVDGLLVLHKGEIVFEAYPRMEAHERHLTWSVTKVVVGTALAALQATGLADMQAPVEQYLPELANTAWAGTRLQDIANMASGIDCLDSDGYHNSQACIYRYEEALGITARVNPQISTTAAIKAMKRRSEPGQQLEYVSANTFVLGRVIESITDKPLWQALQGLIWDKTGAEADALLTVSSEGQAYASGGLSMRLRDLARFGQIFTPNAGLDVVPSSHLEDLRSGDNVPFTSSDLESFDKQLEGDTPSHAAWQWDMIWADGDMFKQGYSGQGIYVSPSRELVIVHFGTHGSDDSEHSLLEIVRQLSTSKLFR
jgi:CubicO group peptidase (beta-lactamase class C family)